MKEPKKGPYKPKNPQKYKGNPTKIIYRSGLELSVMKHFDNHPQVVEWSSEEIIVPYRCKTDNKIHRYFPDFVVTFMKNGVRETHMIEVKPFKQTQEPKKTPGKKQQVYLNEVMTYAKNYSKWEAAKEYCADRKWKFTILTEQQILGKK